MKINNVRMRVTESQETGCFNGWLDGALVAQGKTRAECKINVTAAAIWGALKKIGVVASVDPIGKSFKILTADAGRFSTAAEMMRLAGVAVSETSGNAKTGIFIK